MHARNINRYLRTCIPISFSLIFPPSDHCAGEVVCHTLSRVVNVENDVSRHVVNFESMSPIVALRRHSCWPAIRCKSQSYYCLDEIWAAITPLLLPSDWIWTTFPLSSPWVKAGPRWSSCLSGVSLHVGKHEFLQSLFTMACWQFLHHAAIGLEKKWLGYVF